MSRTIVRTTVAGWYIDAADSDGPRVRKREDDTIITLEEHEASKGRTPSQERAAHAAKSIPASRARRAEPDKHVPTVVSDTGKLLRGKTTTIKCKHKNEDGTTCGVERTIKVQDKFQVRFCVPHQQEHRRQVKREKLKAKRKRDKEAAAKVSS